MRLIVFDIETDNLLEKVTKIHCLSYKEYNPRRSTPIRTIFNKKKIERFFKQKDVIFVGHNISLYDIPVAKKFYNVKIDYKYIIDTLGLSWYLYPKKNEHGLEEWGEYFEIPKVKIDDWQGKNVNKDVFQKSMKERCERDVEINYKLWSKQWNHLLKIYNSAEEAKRLIEYLSFKFDCVREQEENPLKLDIPFIKNNLATLTKEFEDKKKELESVMPQVPIYGDRVVKNVIILNDDIRPTQYITAKENPVDFAYYLSQGYIVHEKTKVKVLKGYKDPNGNSVDQKKAFLFSLGWEPLWYKDSEETKDKQKTGVIRKVPQMNSETEDGELCESVKILMEAEPALEALQGMGRIKHRIGLLEGFLKNQCSDKPGYIRASLAGLTNTLRLKHRNIVNLPSEGKEYWEMIRGSFICEEDELFCGADLSALEDSSKQHFMYKYDPDYVMEMRTPGFCPHLSIAVEANLLTSTESDEHKLYSKTKGKEGKDHSTVRKQAKVVNFSAVYGAGPPKIAATLKCELEFAVLLHTAYWSKNKAVKLVAKDCKVQELYGQKWLFNPISRLWYSLRAEKDRFSTLNQGNGVWIFDNWVKYIRSKGIKISMQMHDEIGFMLKRDKREEYIDKLEEALKEDNEFLKLNIPIACDIKTGNRYSECH